jgi:hypothetical protein
MYLMPLVLNVIIFNMFLIILLLYANIHPMAVVLKINYHYYCLPKQIDLMSLMRMGLFFLPQRCHSFKPIYKCCGKKWSFFSFFFKGATTFCQILLLLLTMMGFEYFRYI